MTGNPLLAPDATPVTGLMKLFRWMSPKRIWQRRCAKKRFYQLAGTDELINFKEWEQALGLRNPMLAKRLCQLVDTDESGFIDLREYLAYVSCLTSASDRRYQLFAIYDQDNDGELQLQAITNPGRPNWPLIFTELRTQHGCLPILKWLETGRA